MCERWPVVREYFWLGYWYVSTSLKSALPMSHCKQCVVRRCLKRQATLRVMPDVRWSRDCRSMKKKKRTPPLLTAQPRMTWLPCRPT